VALPGNTGEVVFDAAGGARSCARAGKASATAAEIIKNRLARTLAHIRFNRPRRYFLGLRRQENQPTNDERQDKDKNN
jgi:hypothetical protein